MHKSLAVVVLAALTGSAGGAEGPPRPVRAWSAGLLEVRVAFDRPVEAATRDALVGSTIVAAVPEAGSAPRRVELNVAGVRAEDGGRTLALATDPHPRAATYTLTIPRAGVADPALARAEGTPVRYDLNGVEASWSAPDADAPTWTGWWPVLEPSAALMQASGSAAHEPVAVLLAKPGKLALRTVPASLPEGEITLEIESGAPFEASFGVDSATSEPGDDGRHRATLTAEPAGELFELAIVAETGAGGKATDLSVLVRTPEDAEGVPIGPRGLLLPWAPPDPPSAASEAQAPDLKGGDPARGKVVFASEQARCAACHRFEGQGGVIGPDLAEVADRDPAWIYRQIAEPSAAIHPNYASFTVALKDGRIALGTVRAEGPDAIKVTDTNAQSVVFKKDEIEELRPSTTSIMPVGLAAAIGEPAVRDLIAYLTAPRTR